MSLETPIKIRMLQRKLYQKAKEEPSYRFYLLYDKMYREDILAHAYARVKSNQGAPGVDGQSFWGIETLGLEEWLNGIRDDLRGKTYQPQAVLRVMIPKPGGGERPLGIPTIRDRVVQTAAKLLLEPIFEADFDPNAYGYRPKRSAQESYHAATHKGAEHHHKAAEHHEHAAKHHREAAKHHEGGSHEKAAHHAYSAHGHASHAEEHHAEASRHHAEQHGQH